MITKQYSDYSVNSRCVYTTGLALHHVDRGRAVYFGASDATHNKNAVGAVGCEIFTSECHHSVCLLSYDLSQHKIFSKCWFNVFNVVVLLGL